MEKTRDLDSLEEFFWLVETGQSVLPVIAVELVGSTSVNNWREAVVAVTKEGLLKRHNYDVEIAGGTPDAHYIDAYVEVSGIKFSTVHRIFARQEDASVNREPLVVSIDVSNIQLS